MGTGPRSSPTLVPLGVLVAAALAAVLLAGSLGGAFVPLDGFSDGGASARWGIPLVRTVHDVFAAVTVGLLVIAGTIVPERSDTDRRGTATRAAALTGGIWALAALVNLLLVVANVSGVGLTEPGYLAQLGQVWSIEFLRVFLIDTVIAVVVVIGATLARTRFAITWCAAIALSAQAVLALVGHAAGAAGHDTAVNSLAIHLLAAVTWVGALAALALLRPTLGSALAVTVARCSTLFLWCYGAIGLSGLLNAAVRLGSWSGLSTAYGALVVAKVVVLLALGLAGWRMRRHVVGRLAADPGARGAFATLALGELVLMGAGMGIGVGMSRSVPPVPQTESSDIVTALTGYPAPAGPLHGLAWFTTFRIDWLWFTVGVLAVALYLAGVLKLRRRGDAWPVHRTIFWVLGWLLFLWVTNGAPNVYGRLQFSTHMLMHMTLTMGVPVLLVVGAPITLAARTLTARRDKTLGPRELLLAVAHSRWMNFWANPVVACVNFVGSIYVFYFTDLFELALRTHVGMMVMVVHFMLAGYVFAWSLIGVDPGPKRWPPSLRLVLLFATMSFHAFFGVTLVSTTQLLAATYFEQLHLPWVPDLLADQVEGGAITWGIGEFPMLVLALAVALVWLRSDEQEAKRRDRQADRDHDAELTAYNDQLRRRAQAYRDESR